MSDVVTLEAVLSMLASVATIVSAVVCGIVWFKQNSINKHTDSDVRGGSQPAPTQSESLLIVQPAMTGWRSDYLSVEKHQAAQSSRDNLIATLLIYLLVFVVVIVVVAYLIAAD